MPMSLQLPAAQFAVWAREHAVRLPYPLDISTVPGATGRPPDPAAPQLARLAQVASKPRVAVFQLRLDPASGTSECAVAVADDAVGVLVSMSPEQVAVRAVPASQLVVSLGATLPAFPPLPFQPTAVPEQRWNQALAAADRPDAAAVVEAAGLPAGVTSAIMTPARSIGTLGAVTWADGTSQLGTLLASWFEYPRGTLLARLEAARQGGGERSVVLAPYSPSTASRALTGIVSHALRAVRG